MKYWVKKCINQIKSNNDICGSYNYKENLHKNISLNDSDQISNDETIPLLQEHTSNNSCIVVDIESNISTINNLVKINSQEKQTIRKSSNYGSI